jgi:hypothetical protein
VFLAAARREERRVLMQRVVEVLLDALMTVAVAIWLAFELDCGAGGFIVEARAALDFWPWFWLWIRFAGLNGFDRGDGCSRWVNGSDLLVRVKLIAASFVGVGLVATVLYNRCQHAQSKHKRVPTPVPPHL